MSDEISEFGVVPEPTYKRYRVRCYKYNDENEMVSLSYYDDYERAHSEYERICDNNEFNNSLGINLTIELSHCIIGRYVPILIDTYVHS